ncbi:hypothetical protein, partial [Flavobacterium sp.]|uniref:hypothetical protein n=1 Tax=Flavobacterium sp. TaxID=239 RepID=UPI0025B94DB6
MAARIRFRQKSSDNAAIPHAEVARGAILRNRKKTFARKNRLSSDLRESVKKLRKKPCRKLAETKKRATFAPAFSNKFIGILATRKEV